MSVSGAFLTLEHVRKSVTAFAVFLFLFCLLIVIGLGGCGPTGSIPAFEYVRPALEPVEIAFDDQGFRVVYKAGPLEKVFESGDFEIILDEERITCRYVLHTIDPVVAEPDTWIWITAGNDPRCETHIEELGAGKKTEQPATLEPDASSPKDENDGAESGDPNLDAKAEPEKDTNTEAPEPAEAPKPDAEAELEPGEED